jgi:hypothetical protein
MKINYNSLYYQKAGLFTAALDGRLGATQLKRRAHHIVEAEIDVQ